MKKCRCVTARSILAGLLLISCFSVSAVSQNRPVMVEIKGFKTSHFLEHKTAPRICGNARPMGHVERTQSAPASSVLQFTRQRLVPAADSTRAWAQSRDGWPVFTLGKTSHFDRRL